MNSSPLSVLQLGEGPGLQGFREAPVHDQDRDRCKEKGAVNSSAALALLNHCLNTLPEVVIQHKNQLRHPQTGTLETYGAAEWISCGRAGGIGPVCWIGSAGLPVLNLKLLQLQREQRVNENTTSTASQHMSQFVYIVKYQLKHYLPSSRKEND